MHELIKASTKCMATEFQRAFASNKRITWLQQTWTLENAHIVVRCRAVQMCHGNVILSLFCIYIVQGTVSEL